MLQALLEPRGLLDLLDLLVLQEQLVRIQLLLVQQVQRVLREQRANSEVQLLTMNLIVELPTPKF